MFKSITANRLTGFISAKRLMLKKELVNITQSIVLVVISEGSDLSQKTDPEIFGGYYIEKR